LMTIHIGLPFAEQVEVGAVDDGDFHIPNIRFCDQAWARTMSRN
jgi:hypothetical protein